MPTDNRRPDHIGEAAEMVRTACEAAIIADRRQRGEES